MIHITRVDLTDWGVELPHDRVGMVVAQPYLTLTQVEPFRCAPDSKPQLLANVTATLNVALRRPHGDASRRDHARRAPQIDRAHADACLVIVFNEHASARAIGCDLRLASSARVLEGRLRALHACVAKCRNLRVCCVQRSAGQRGAGIELNISFKLLHPNITGQHFFQRCDTNQVFAAVVKVFLRFTDATVAPWLDHVTAIFGEPGDPAREHFLDFFGFAMQNPGVKINHALVVLGMQGVGKDTAFAPIFEALGEHNVGTIKPEDLAGQFTPFLENQIVCVQEMSNFTKREVYNRLKHWIAAPPRFVTINKKNQHPYTIPNTQIWVFFTNYDDAIALDEDDRRFWVHRAPAESVPSDAYFTSLHQWYGAGGVECVFGWLKQRDVSAFNPMARPPATDAKRAMLDRSQPAALKWLRALFQEGEPLHGRTVTRTDAIGDAVMIASGV
jgi:hypothetical protein